MAKTPPKSLLSDDDLYLFNEGSHFTLYDHLGAHPVAGGAWFAVWAPAAQRVAVVGDFNGWDGAAHPLAPRGSSGIWEGFVRGAEVGQAYKYRVLGADGAEVDKADPFGRMHQVPPETASILHADDYAWGDAGWMAARAERDALGAPMSIYEVHLGSWRRVPEEGDRHLSYRELAPLLADYAVEMGFTHVELLPVMEHPFYGSWGYQVTGYFAPTSRYGSPEDLKFLIDTLHGRGVGVILDWVPSHFPTDAHALARFDGTHLYEHADPRKGFHPDWKSAIFNYDRHEVRAFLISSALFWLDHFHVDALRVDAVASMLYLDYSRAAGEWIPNEYGGRENLGAIQLLRRLNEAVYARHPGAQTIAEESTAWPNVSRPTYIGGLGFGMKWDMGWMHDTLRYLRRDPVHRRYHHNEITFRAVYMHSENYVVSLSHDEVVHGKGALVDQMPGDDWRKFANLRLLYGNMYAQPGKNLLFMGCEFGQWREWSHERSLDWDLLEQGPYHEGTRRWVRDLNRLTAEHPALHERDFHPDGFSWVDASDSDQSVLTFVRWDAARRAPVLVCFNFTPEPRHRYRVGAPTRGAWREIANSDDQTYGGSGVGNPGDLRAQGFGCHGFNDSLIVTLPPLAVVMFAPR